MHSNVETNHMEKVPDFVGMRLLIENRLHSETHHGQRWRVGRILCFDDVLRAVHFDLMRDSNE